MTHRRWKYQLGKVSNKADKYLFMHTMHNIIMLHLKFLQPKLVNANRITISIKIGLKPRQHFYMAITKTNILWA